MRVKFAVGLWLFGRLADRFTVYHEAKDLRGKIEEAARVRGVDGLEIFYPAEFTDERIGELKDLLKVHGLEIAALLADLTSETKWIRGSFTSRDDALRREAIERTKRTMDVCKELECDKVNLWLGHDGYDYVFQADYIKAWDWLIKGIRECAEHRSDIRISLEYKPKEPRTHFFMGTVGKALLIAEEVGSKNVGVTIDVGHALYAGENPAESAVLLNRYGRLFHTHINDNYRDWDHDMIVATVNPWDTLELFYWLKRVDYDGWITLDIYPYREDVTGACEQSIENMKAVMKLLEKIGVEELDECIEGGEALKIAMTLRKLLE